MSKFKTQFMECFPKYIHSWKMIHFSKSKISGVIVEVIAHLHVMGMELSAHLTRSGSAKGCEGPIGEAHGVGREDESHRLFC